ncbi:DUF3169 family protein [Serpentinicella sp. ANB-PHB4]|uniref:DUF3169 family protein n=1 Tax=Serpentinicella sp. ANB-PHB4 TaxID=3074076 RepID=UPI00285BB34D|nr:DUF3169 family protein [Serpentinicella sp. ANB-PHB4]MDR5659208.1 DUF3169 family protein [Serpentinicella sp. ANB-PHB4]
MKQNKKDYLKIILWMVLGGLGGAIGMIGMLYIKESTVGYTLFSDFANFFIENIFYVQLGLAILTYGMVSYWLKKAKRLKEEARIETDEEQDLFDEKLDKLLNSSLLVNSVHLILSFMLFGIAFDDRNPLFWPSLIIFLLVSFVESAVEVHIVRSIQEHDPMKKGDPTSTKFHSVWLDSCDEAERTYIYKVGYHAFITMQNVLMWIFVATLFIKFIFHTGNLTILIVGGIWLTNQLAYFYYAAKENRDMTSVER